MYFAFQHDFSMNFAHFLIVNLYRNYSFKYSINFLILYQRG